jgi:hypothetical protein
MRAASSSDEDDAPALDAGVHAACDESRGQRLALGYRKEARARPLFVRASHDAT